ncbi:hypothetical protein BCR37DRAFT_115147 [Protomyces lactucae-debilis]|uniref:Cyanovirin-N domain-containing protein n=1 Tax=Protomyces lactucae-debilis TaxID=2754530 RepID=A0A1Y2F3A5_PROLT|nr:uncharacterized protein BCR37DRAFT_115147 [Protomyces lactucae-debilis]ORY78167.1 hypothetical protein BCR37DRAFT_115147 [Protomyces lactucae-debilis]
MKEPRTVPHSFNWLCTLLILSFSGTLNLLQLPGFVSSTEPTDITADTAKFCQQIALVAFHNIEVRDRDAEYNCSSGALCRGADKLTAYSELPIKWAFDRYTMIQDPCQTHSHGTCNFHSMSHWGTMISIYACQCPEVVLLLRVSESPVLGPDGQPYGCDVSSIKSRLAQRGFSSFKLIAIANGLPCTPVRDNLTCICDKSGLVENIHGGDCYRLSETQQPLLNDDMDE